MNRADFHKNHGLTEKKWAVQLKKSIYYLLNRSDEFVLKIDGTEVIPYVDYPIADNINWYSYRNIYPYNGTLYEVETVVAQPKAGYKSSLMLEGHAIIEQDTSTNWVAGAVEAVKVVVFDGMGEAIPKASFVLTVYDSAKAFVAGISKVTVLHQLRFLILIHIQLMFVLSMLRKHPHLIIRKV